MSAIEKVKAHYSAQGTREMEVPEWELTIHARPMTLQATEVAFKRADGSTAAYWVHAIIANAFDPEGNKIFNIGDLEELLNSADADVVARVGQWITGSASPEDHTKNFATTEEN